MQINPVNNQTFKACYKIPYTKEGYETLMGALKYESSQNFIATYGKKGRCAKDIAVFRDPFPFEHLYNQELISILLNHNRVTEEEAAKYRINFNIFRSARVSREVQCEILNSHFNTVRNKGIDVDSIFDSGRIIYITTCEDTKALKKSMAPKIEAHFKKCFGDRKQLDPIEAAGAMLSFNPGPQYPIPDKPKQNFIQRLLGKNKEKEYIISLQQQYNELIKSLDNLDKEGSLSEKEFNVIQDKINAMQAKLEDITEPVYIKKARFLVEQFKLETERFHDVFFKDREITSVPSVERLFQII